MKPFSFDGLRKRWQEELERRKARSAAIHEAVLGRGVPVLKSYKIKKAILFGSATEGKASAGSDVDLLVMPLAAADYWQCRRELEEALDLPLDLCTQDDDPVFVQKILERGEVIHEEG